MDITLTPEQEAIIKQKMKSGGYRTPSDVVDEALQLLVEREIEESVGGIEVVRAMVQKGLEQLDRGEGIEITDRKAFVDGVMKRARQQLEAPKKQKTYCAHYSRQA